ncbi:MAG: hypothetical protein WAX29_06985 [Propionibacterium sp.]
MSGEVTAHLMSIVSLCIDAAVRDAVSWPGVGPARRLARFASAEQVDAHR